MGAGKEVCPGRVGNVEGTKKRVQVGGGHSEEFDVGVGIHQRSVLSMFFLETS